MPMPTECSTANSVAVLRSPEELSYDDSRLRFTDEVGNANVKTRDQRRRIRKDEGDEVYSQSRGYA